MEKAYIEIIKFNAQDIITTSSTNLEPDPSNPGDGKGEGGWGNETTNINN